MVPSPKQQLLDSPAREGMVAGIEMGMTKATAAGTGNRTGMEMGTGMEMVEAIRTGIRTGMEMVEAIRMEMETVGAMGTAMVVETEMGMGKGEADMAMEEAMEIG